MTQKDRYEQQIQQACIERYVNQQLEEAHKGVNKITDNNIRNEVMKRLPSRTVMIGNIVAQDQEKIVSVEPKPLPVLQSDPDCTVSSKKKTPPKKAAKNKIIKKKEVAQL